MSGVHMPNHGIPMLEIAGTAGRLDEAIVGVDGTLERLGG
jgi:hypothetical protein